MLVSFSGSLLFATCTITHYDVLLDERMRVHTFVSDLIAHRCARMSMAPEEITNFDSTCIHFLCEMKYYQCIGHRQ